MLFGLGGVALLFMTLPSIAAGVGLMAVGLVLHLVRRRRAVAEPVTSS